MNEKERRKKSKFLSLVLRHQPETIGIELNEAGWVDVNDLISALARHGRRMSRETLEEVVRTNDKQRFSFNEDGSRIRANQGHSVDIELGYRPATPPEILYHGTPQRFVEAISRDGLKKMNRHHVHLHVDVATSTAVGRRRGKPVLLKVKALEMHHAGYEFFVTPNDVWLTDNVPMEFIAFP
ncbi:MAG: RNA 2'-phosphotransferase [Pirellulaceae bacterium]|nr:RNA 2'-phosphotransferase [Pirellulaceae bacterium]MDP6554406.1 RNA 2'-phosphotransferase [Pirellulaceae bacterium]